MLKKVLAIGLAATVFGIGGVALASTGSNPLASASTATTKPAAPDNTKVAEKCRGAHQRRQQRRAAVLKIAADTIGVDQSVIVDALKNQQSIADVATAHNVDPQKVIDALVSAVNTKLDAAVAAGRLDAERAASIKQRAPQRIAKLVNHKGHSQQVQALEAIS